MEITNVERLGVVMEELFTWDSVGWKLIIPLRLGLLQVVGVVVWSRLVDDILCFTSEATWSVGIERVESGKQLEKLLRLVGNFVHVDLFVSW